MIETLNILWQLILESFEWIAGAMLSNIFAIIGFVLAILIIIRIFREQRQPSSIIAWSFLIVFVPYLGVPLYILLGGRKLKKKIRSKGLLTAIDSDDGVLSPVKDQFSTEGNQVEVVTDGTEAYQHYCDAILNAENEIHILTYILSNDEVGNAILDLLIKRSREGVRVRLLMDALGSFKRPRNKIKDLIAAGGEVSLFMPALPLQTHGWANLRNHRKLGVFDNKLALLGGRNLDKRFMGSEDDPERFHDLGVVYRGPIVAYLNRIFLSDWIFASKKKPQTLGELEKPDFKPIGESRVSGIASGPDVSGDLLYEKLVNLTQEFRSSLTIVTPYFIPDEVLIRSMIVKARSGKKVTIIIPEKSNWAMVDFARSYYLRELKQAGINVLLFQKGMLHAKVMVVDDSVALHGSANFDIRSLFVNFEIGMLHHDRADIAIFNKWLDEIKIDCRPFGLEKEMHPTQIRRLAEEATRLFAPLL